MKRSFKETGLLAAQRSGKRRNMKKIKSQPDEILLLAELNDEQSEYTLILDDKSQSDYPISKALAYRNGFKAAGMAVGVLPVPIRDGKLMWGALPPAYFADERVFTEPAGTARLSESEAVQGVWFGHFTVQTNEGIRIDKQPLLSYMTTLQTQSSATAKSMFDGSEVKSLGGVITLSGGDDNYINIKVQCLDKTHIGGNADHKNFIIVRLIGAGLKGETTSAIQNR